MGCFSHEPIIAFVYLTKASVNEENEAKKKRTLEHSKLVSELDGCATVTCALFIQANKVSYKLATTLSFNLLTDGKIKRSQRNKVPTFVFYNFANRSINEILGSAKIC